jgi:hypothetical protein
MARRIITTDRNKTTYPRIMSQNSRYRVGVRPFIKNVKVSSFHSSHETSKSFHRVHLQNRFKCINGYTNRDCDPDGERWIHGKIQLPLRDNKLTHQKHSPEANDYTRHNCSPTRPPIFRIFDSHQQCFYTLIGSSTDEPSQGCLDQREL